MATTASLKNLRVALIQGSKITEDRTLKRRVSVSVGQDARNTFVVPVSNLPSSFQLFELTQDQYSLCFKAGMEGELSLDGQKLTLEQAQAKGLAKTRGDVFVLPLNDGAKGRVALGEVTLLFQFVTPPPEAPRTELPLEIRGSFFSQVDRFFFTVLSISLLFHFSGMVYLAMQKMPEEQELSLDELPDRFVKAMMPVEIKKPEKKAEVADKGKADEKKDDKPKAADEGKKAATSNSKEKVAAAVASKGLLKIIGSASGGGGAFDDVLGNSNGVGNIADALSGASGVGVATSDNVGTGGPRGGTAGTAAGIGDLGTSGGGNVGLGEKVAAQVHGKVADSTPDVESGTVDREKLASYVRARKGAIQNCYEKELKRSPTLKGKVTVRFSITSSGRTSEIEIEENTLGNEAVASCIRTLIRGWVFPFKPDGDVSVSYPFVFSPAS